VPTKKEDCVFFAPVFPLTKWERLRQRSINRMKEHPKSESKPERVFVLSVVAAGSIDPRIEELVDCLLYALALKAHNETVSIDSVIIIIIIIHQLWAPHKA